MLCKKCGAELPENTTKCPSCGEENAVAPALAATVKKSISKKNIITIIIIAVILIAGGITAAVVLSGGSSVSMSASDMLQIADKYLKEMNYEQAIVEFQKVLEIEPKNVDAYIGLADAYIGLGDNDKAIEVLEKAKEILGDNQRINNKLSELTSQQVESITETESPASEAPATEPGETTSEESEVPSVVNKLVLYATEPVLADMSEIHGANGLQNFGRNVYGYWIDSSMRGFIKIDDNDLNKWKETGKISYTDINADTVFTDSNVTYVWYTDTCNFGDGDYMTIGIRDKDDNELSRFAVKYDEETNTITKVRDLEMIYDGIYDNAVVTYNGTTLSVKANNDNKTVTVTAIDANGEPLFTNTHNFFCDSDEYINEGDQFRYNICISTRLKDVCYYVTGKSLYQGVQFREVGVQFYAVDYSGNIKEVANVGSWYDFAIGHGVLYDDEHALVVYGSTPMIRQNVKFYINGEEFSDLEYPTIDGLENNQPGVVGIEGIEGYVVPIAFRTSYDIVIDGVSVSNFYALYNFKDNKVISDFYQNISQSHDGGESYLVKNFEGKWGHINKDGTLYTSGENQAAFFDDAGAFNGDYAPVIIDGKAYIIDKNMNAFDLGMDANSTWTISKDIFCFKQ